MRRFLELITLCGLILIISAPAYAAEAKRLVWTCPTCKTDGAVGFRIYYGPVSHADVETPAPVPVNPAAPYEHVITLTGIEQMQAVVIFSKGTYYVRATSYDDANESTFSNEVEVEIKLSAPVHLIVE